MQLKPLLSNRDSSRFATRAEPAPAKAGALGMTLCFLLSVLPNVIWSAPCCTSSAGAPSLIIANDEAQISLGSRLFSVIGDSYKSSPAIFRAPYNKEKTTVLFVSGAYRLTPRWQIHFDLPFSLRSRSAVAASSSHESLADIVSGVAFEAIEELEYTPWKPRLLVFFDLIFPAGRSVYESRDPLGSDIHGKGFFSGQAGLYFWKVWDPWDASLLLSCQQGTSRKFGGTERINPGNTLFASLNIGFKLLRRLRMGLGIGPSYDSTIKINGVHQPNSHKLVWNVSADAAVIISNNWKLNLSYSDQTLLGPTFNTTLSRGALFSLNRTFEL